MVLDFKCYPSVGVWLRLPGILFMELILADRISSEALLHMPYASGTIFMKLAHWILTFSLYSLALTLILLPVNILKSIHFHVLWLISIASSHTVFIMTHKKNIEMWTIDKPRIFSPRHQMLLETENTDVAEKCITVILIQLVLCLTACWCKKSKGFMEIALNFLPMATWIYYLKPKVYLSNAINTSLYLCLATTVLHFLTRYNLYKAVEETLGHLRLVKMLFGWRGIIALGVNQCELPDLLMWAWVTKVSAQMAFNFYHPINEIKELSGSTSTAFLIISLMSVVQCTATLFSLAGIAIFTSRALQCNFFLIRSWLNASFVHHAPDPVDVGAAIYIDGLTMMIMFVYVEIVELDFYPRALFMIYIFLTVFSSQMRTIYSIVDAFLITLATVQNASLFKHIRTGLLAFSLIYICAICSYNVVLYFGNENIFWTVVISHNFISTIALTTGSLMIYLIMLMDSRMVVSFQNIDDIIFYVRGLCEFFEFVLTIVVSFLVISSVYNDVGGIPGTVLLAFYNYYNLMTKGKNGWTAWRRRRDAKSKVESLPEVNGKEREELDDVCSICYQDLSSDSDSTVVRKMHCGHMFHGDCLTKWFQIQDKCPICHKDFNDKQETSAEKGTNENTNGQSPEQSSSLEESGDNEEQSVNEDGNSPN